MSAIASAIKVQKLNGANTTYEVLMGRKRIGYVGLAQKDNPAPVSWLPKSVGGLEMKPGERAECVRRINELMAAEWEKHAEEIKRLRAIENGLPLDDEPETTEDTEGGDDAGDDTGGDQAAAAGG